MTQNNYLSVRHANFWRLVYLVVFLPLEKSFQQKHLNFSERQRCWKKFILKLQENEDINFLPFLQQYTELTQKLTSSHLADSFSGKTFYFILSLLEYCLAATSLYESNFSHRAIYVDCLCGFSGYVDTLILLSIFFYRSVHFMIEFYRNWSHSCERYVKYLLHKKSSFPSSISSVNVTK